MKATLLHDSVDENAAVGTDVGYLFLVNKDGSGIVRFNFPDHNDKFEYVVLGNKEAIQIKTKVRLNYEVQSSYTVELIIKYSDHTLNPNESFLKVADTVTVTINVNDMPERPIVGFGSGNASTADALPILTSAEREHIISLLTLDTIIFNELFNASNDTHDWIELRNVTNADVDLSGWHLIVATGGTTIVHEFSTGTILPAGELLLLLNTDPDDLTCRWQCPRCLRTTIFMMRLLLYRRKNSCCCCGVRLLGKTARVASLFGQEKLPTTVDFALDTAWFRAKATVFGHRNNAWIISGYHDDSVMIAIHQQT